MTGERWEILRTLGSGGFGTVYLAEYQGESDFSKQVALKVLNEEVSGSAEIARRLRDEARVLGLVRHRAIVQVDRLTRIEDRWTVVMEYVDGCDLAAAIAEQRLPPRPALEIVAETAAALHHAWIQLGPDGAPLRLLHRDIKPSNLQLTSAGEVKILDFGIARADFDLRESQTRSVMFGSLPYMSPERLDFRDEPGGDVYALAVCLLEALTGEGLGRTSAREDRHHTLLDAADAAMMRAEVPAEVRALVREMLAYEPEDRPEMREVERRALALAEQVGGARLRDWAEQAVPRAGAHRTRVPPAPLTGTLVTSGAGDPDALEVQPLPEPRSGATGRRRGPLLAVVGGLTSVVAVAAVLLAVVGLGVAALVLQPAPGEAPPVATTEHPSPAVDAPAKTPPEAPEGAAEVASEPDAPPDAPAPASATPTRPVATPTRPPVRAPTAAAPVPTPAAPVRATPPPQVATGLVRLTGEPVAWLEGDTRVELRGKREVPAGRYLIELEVDGVPTSVGSVEVPAGGVKVLSCSAAFARCSVGEE